MKSASLGCLLFCGLLYGGIQDSDLNVNTQYTVDAVTLWGKGWRTDLTADHTSTDEHTKKMSPGLRRDLIGLIGKRLNPDSLDALAGRLRKELGAREVDHRLQRGDTPNHVRVEFQVKPPHVQFDTTLTKFAYNSIAGWSGGGEAGITVHDHSFTFGMVSDGDTMAERFAGVTARYEDHHLGSDKLDFRLDFETYHEQWNNNSIAAAADAQDVTNAVYRARQNVQPMLAMTLAKPLTLEVGASFERFQEETPGAPFLAANALVADLRYHRMLESDAYPQEIEADYALRSANRTMASDFVYTSHAWKVRYRISHGKQSVTDTMSAGLITGRAPISDRFLLGNSTMLAGWNKYDLDPIGGNRMAYNSVEYRYGLFDAFYDTGAIWDAGQTAIARHAIGVGLRESVFTLAVAFPVRGGKIEPIFIMGLLY